ncbi:Cytochrome P450 monooygenase 1 [Colletotrichum siamense]|uniref:Cytochrome P450 monooygenase 1 n=1 Tax=Colletotrichum siamense TaxID=690259 RepID=A0A9P5EWG4_COLSI|nr:Cytochrome P450 monooygenase 1 [Colletotrichum siamense]KAF4860801.1 Cytochrome P450 monooygenase 1 [Colletotrichum siamense]
MDVFNTTSFENAVTDRQDPSTSPWYVVASCATVAILSLFLMRDRTTKLPYLNPKKPFEWSSARAAQEIILNARNLMYLSANSLLGKPFRVLGDVGDVIILPPDVGQEIRNDKRFSFTQGLADDFQAHYSGFEPYKEACDPAERLQNVVKLRLTKTLGKITSVLSQEADMVIKNTLTDSKDPHDVVLKEVVLDVVSRLSGRIFVGERLGRNDEWLHTVINYVETSVFAMQDMRKWPEFLRPIVAWFLPRTRLLRAYIRDAEKHVFAEIKRRKEESPAVEYLDGITWFEEMAKGQKYNPAVGQLMLASVAVHTTADLVCQAMYDILQHPELIQPLREEVIRVIGEGGWKKTSLHNMKLMDSVLKESQRLKPNQIVGMNRKTVEDIQLPDGTFLARGASIVVSAERMWDPKVYANPLEFDGYRYFKERSGPNDAVSQLVSTSTSHMGFGHGMHSCPGRFFAGNEAKVILAHFLLKYDFEFAENQTPKYMEYGFTCESDSTVKVSVRRRKEEIDLSVQDPQAE